MSIYKEYHTCRKTDRYMNLLLILVYVAGWALLLMDGLTEHEWINCLKHNL